MLRCQASWLELNAWLLALCNIQRHHSQTLRPDHSVCWRQDPHWKLSHRKYEDSISWFFRPFYKPVLTILKQCCVQHWLPGISQTFPPIILTILDIVEETDVFCLCHSFFIFWHGPSSKAFWYFLAYNLRGKGLPDQRPFFRYSETFQRCFTQ